MQSRSLSRCDQLQAASWLNIRDFFGAHVDQDQLLVQDVIVLEVVEQALGTRLRLDARYTAVPGTRGMPCNTLLAIP